MGSKSVSSLEQRFFEELMLPGDVLLFKRQGFFNWIIRHATNGPITHTEMYVGGGKTIAARNGKGVATYPFDHKGLYMILRAPQHRVLDMDKVMAWQATVDGHKYDWTGLVRSFVANKWSKPDDKWWCSEHTTEASRQGGIEPFSGPEHFPSDAVSPMDWLKTSTYGVVWKSKE